jgi:hypothetical protein
LPFLPPAGGSFFICSRKQANRKRGYTPNHERQEQKLTEEAKRLEASTESKPQQTEMHETSPQRWF